MTQAERRPSFSPNISSPFQNPIGHSFSFFLLLVLDHSAVCLLVLSEELLCASDFSSQSHCLLRCRACTEGLGAKGACAPDEQLGSHCQSLPRLNSGWLESTGSAGLSCNTGEVPGPAFPLWLPWCLPASATSEAFGKLSLSVHLFHSHGRFHRSETQ